MSTLLLIRHGDNEYLKKNRLPGHQPGIHLNEHGRQQAAELARTLGPLPIKAIYSSPLERAVETAEPLAKALGLEIQLRPLLTDVDPGKWTGRSWKVLRRTKEWKVIQYAPSLFRFPGGETFLEAQQRVVATLEELSAAHKKEMIAVFFHADSIRLAVSYYLGLPVDNFQRLTIFAGSVTILGIEAMSARLLACNLIPPFALPKL